MVCRRAEMDSWNATPTPDSDGDVILAISPAAQGHQLVERPSRINARTRARCVYVRDKEGYARAVDGAVRAEVGRRPVAARHCDANQPCGPWTRTSQASEERTRTLRGTEGARPVGWPVIQNDDVAGCVRGRISIRQ